MTSKFKILYHRFLAGGLEDHTDHAAVKHVIALADLDNEWGLHELGYRYDIGKSVDRNYEKALFFYKRAFEKKGDVAQYAAANIGSLYLNGNGVPKSEAKAAKWFKKAAELGHPESQYNYGLSLIDGWDSKYNKEEGVFWLKKSADSGVSQAKEVLKKVGEQI